MILALVFSSVLVLTVFFAVFIVKDVNAFKQRKAESMLSMAQVIGTNSISTLQFRDDEAAALILSELHNVAPEIVHAVILDENGNYFAKYSRPGADSLQIPAGLKANSSLFTHQG